MMRLVEILLAIAIVLAASTDAVSATPKRTTHNGFYADLYNVEDGAVTNKLRVPLGDANQYKKSDFKALKKTLNQEERAAVFFPRGFNSLIKGFERFVGFFGRSKRRLGIDEA
ncbi:hypothetical protein L917_06909 [Phytophthora nicotianae]|uniref:RxLR effector protein n=1 Tax=Phytophthora nicotianae TaxID=4792 RepID=W2LEY0_PHYNI|nr:hypothetical protein L917_06909 [Phytophthora nicotianae]